MRAIRFMIAIAILVGCGGEVAHPISEWTLAYDGTSERVVLPQHFDVPDRAMTFTLRADFAVPPELRDRPLSLVIPFFSGITRLRVDSLDAIDTEPELVRGYRARGPKSWQFPAETRGRAQLSLEIAVDHRWKQSGWLDTIPRVVPSGQHDSLLTAIKLINDYGAALALFGLTLVGVLYLGIYLVDRRRKQYKWFAIQGLSAISYPLFLSGLSQGLFGRFDVALLAALLPTAALAAVAFTHATFKLARPSRVWLVLFVINGLVAVIASNPFAAMDYAARVAVATITLVVVYQIWICGRLAFRRTDRPVGARYLLFAWSGLAIAAGPDFAVWLGFGDQLGGVRTSCLGLGLFAIAQALLLGREHVLSLKHADELNAALASRVDQLEGRQKEIELLNTELRRQIADRSEELFGALRTLAATAGSAPALAEGQIVQDRYRVVRSLGTGGMGAVYEVVRIADDKRFALKVTRQHDAVALARLAREARIAAQVTHPNVVAIIDVDVASAGFLFMVIELVDGKALHERVDRYRDQAWMIPVLAQIAAGLAALHRHGIVHRDLKPANILIEEVDGKPRVKITDFGISRISDDEPEGDVTALLKPAAHDSSKRTPNRASTPLTTTGFVAGTPMYMAPELTTGNTAEVLPSADVFSFGILAFQVLAGHPPWSEPPSVTSAARRAVPRPRSLTEEVPTLPKPFSQLVTRCLAMAPEERPTSAELADAFDKLAAEKKAG